MDSQQVRNLQEAYIDVYEGDLTEEQEFKSWVTELLDEGYDLSDYTLEDMYEIYNEERDPGVKEYPGGASYSLRTRVRKSNEVKPAGKKPPGETSGYGQVSPDGKKDPLKTPEKDERNFENSLAPKPKAFPRIFGTLDPANTRNREITRQMGKPKPEAPRRKTKNEEYDLYDLILSHLISEGYADTQEAAESIMVNMSEDWRESIVEAKKPLPVAKMRDKENRMREEPYTPGETRASTLDHNRRLGNIEDVRRSVSTRGGKRAMMNPMPDVRRPKNRDED